MGLERLVASKCDSFLGDRLKTVRQRKIRGATDSPKHSQSASVMCAENKKRLN
jgi:hypothetical protein